MWYGVSEPVLTPDDAQEYWHIGETQIRLRSVLPLMLNGLKIVGVSSALPVAVPGEGKCNGVKNGMSGTGTLLRAELVILSISA